MLAKFLLSSTAQNTVSGFSITEKDPATCETLASSAMDACFNVVAVNTGDVSLCEKIAGSRQKDICYSGMANKLQDGSLCERISDATVQGLCQKNIE
jgi:hypothetical protein